MANPGENPYPLVPIDEDFAQLCAQTLATYREIAEDAFERDEAKYQNSVFKREADSINAMPDGEKKEARRALYDLALDYGDMMWEHQLEHVRALEHLIWMTPPPVWSPLAVARVPVEAGAQAHYILDPSITLNQRLARIVCLRVKEDGHGSKAAGLLGSGTAYVADGKHATDTVIAAADARPRKNNQNKVIGYSVDGQRAPLKVTMEELIEKFLPDWAVGTYHILSGATHARPWMIARARANGGWEGEIATITAAMLPAMGALASSLETWSKLMGTPFNALTKMEEVRLGYLHQLVEHGYHQPFTEPLQP